MRTLKMGDVGQDVEVAQQKLVEHGFPPGALDGNFGVGTQAAVLGFQRSENLLKRRTRILLKSGMKLDVASSTQ